jgi:hypothetical protein
MSWEEQKRTLSQLKSNLDSRTTNGAIENIVAGMNAAIMRYTQNAGIAQGNNGQNTDYTDANAKFSQLASLQEEYQKLNQTLSRTVKTLTDNSDVRNKLEQIGRLRGEIVELEKELTTVKQEAETSQARQATVEKPREQLSWYQGFGGAIGFTNPLRQVSVPFLIGFGLLFLYFSGLMLKEVFAPATDTYATNSTYQQEGLFALFTDSRFYAVIGGIGLVGVVLGILSYTGRLGKVVR